MKCRLCDQPTPGKVKLCRDCTNALMRARARSAAKRQPPTSLPDRVEAVAGTSAPPLPWAMSVVAPGRRRHVAWAAGALVALGILYLGQREMELQPIRDTVGVDRASTSWSKPSGVNAPEVAMPSDAPSAPVPSHLAVAAVKTGARGGTTSTNANRDSKSSSPPSTLSSETAAGKAKGEPPPEAEASQLLARASVSPSVSPTDSGQSYASAVEKCGNGGPLSRFICEQKVYMQYCEDKWEKDPRCMRTSGNR